MSRRDDIDWPAELAKAKEEGIHAAELARRLDVLGSTVCRWRRHFAVDLVKGPRGRQPARADWKTVLPLHAAEGKTLGWVAAKYNVTKAAVCKQCARHGVKLRQAKRGVKEQGRAA